MARFRFLRALPVLLAASLGAPAVADAATSASASYVVNLGGTIIATAKFRFEDDGKGYSLVLDANVSGLAQLVASGTAHVESAGTVTPAGLASERFDLLTRANGESFSIKVHYTGGSVSAFVVEPPIVNNIDRIPLERKQLSGVNDFLSSFILRRPLDASVCAQKARIFTGVERFDLDFTFARNDKATSQRTGYQGPVVLCSVKYRPISGHFTTSEVTRSLAEEDRILIWYAPLRDTGYVIPYRVLLTTSMGDLSMVLTSLD